ncbi:GTP-binding protein EngA [Olavius algarvensis associated proteobacterium Delta 3]|nr:GTP-binding protein EngA [Olavius algarvensis associated proteobacterium Delta 3]
MKPIVALVGRPNVGKSTLFNRVTRSRLAIVDDMPGITRDRNYGDAEWGGSPFTLVDTGGFIGTDLDPFAEQIHRQLHMALEDADSVVLLLDGKHGLSPYDADMIAMLRSLSKPVFYTVNKIDAPDQEDRLSDFYTLGIDTFYPISAEHGYGISDLMDDVIRSFPTTPSESDSGMVRVAVVGRPNVGKSSLINRILGEERMLVSEVPGTTRDAVDSVCHVGDRRYRLVDTAGIRRKGRVSRKIEKFSVIRALRSLARSDVALTVLDAHEGITDQDIHVAGYALERGCGCILLLNKWDIVDKGPRTEKRFVQDLQRQAKYLNFAPLMTISARTGLRVRKIFRVIDTLYDQYTSRIGTGQLNRVIKDALRRNEPAFHKGRRLNFYYATQVATKPPTFVFFVNHPEAVHFSYRRYLANRIREATGLDQTPIRTYFRKRTGRPKKR